MNINTLKYFIAIAENASFSKAAEEVFISQSSLSKHIKALEDALEVRLIDRTSNKIQLTEMGEVFLSFAKNGLNNYDELIEKVKLHKNCEQNLLKIGSIPIVASHKIDTLFAKFQATYSESHIDYYESNQQSLLKMLDEKKIALAIVRTDRLTKGKYDFINIIRDEMVLVCSTKNSLSQQAIVTPKEVAAEKILLIENYSNIYHICVSEFKKDGIDLNIIYTNSRHYILLGMVSENIGVTLMPAKLVDKIRYPNVVCVRLSKEIFSDIALIKLNEVKLNTMQNLFWEYFREQAYKF